jgi:hypothetical protein
MDCHLEQSVLADESKDLRLYFGDLRLLFGTSILLHEGFRIIESQKSVINPDGPRVPVVPPPLSTVYQTESGFLAKELE